MPVNIFSRLTPDGGLKGKKVPDPNPVSDLI